MSSSSSSVPHSTFPFTNLVFSGGGMRGCGYTKLWSVLEEYNIAPQIKAVIGVSAGSIIAGMIAMGFSGSEIESMVRSMKFGDFADNSFGITLDIYRLISRFGWNRGDVFLQWYGAIIAKRFHNSDGSGNPDATLQEIFQVTGIEFNAIATCLELEEGRIFNYKTDPDLPLRMLVRMSISVPVFFLPVIYQGRTYVDGGVVNNYPIWYFDNCGNHGVSDNTDNCDVSDNTDNCDVSDNTDRATRNECKTIGFRLIGNPHPKSISTPKDIVVANSSPWTSTWQWLQSRILGRSLIEPPVYHISNIKDYVSSLISTMFHTIESSAIHQGYWERTVQIDTDVMGSIDFDPDPALVELVINNGEKALRSYLDEYMRSHHEGV